MPIFDQGYQHWQGPLSGHVWRWMAITRQGTRVQVKNRILRFLLIVAWIPAVALVVAMALWGLLEQKSAGILGIARNLGLPPDLLLDPSAYRLPVWTVAYSFFFKNEMFFIMLLVVIAGPGLISGDLRFNALPLYFSRPLTRFDYFLGKLGVIGALVASVAVGPAVMAYVVGVCFSLNLGVVKDTYPVLLASVAYGLVITLSVGTLMLALSSLSRRSLYIGIAWAGLWIISGSVGSILTQIHRETARLEAREAELSRWLAENPPPPGVQMQGTHPVTEYQRSGNKVKLAGVAPEQEEEADRWFRDWSRANQVSWTTAMSGQEEALRRDWRPLFSYVANLDRMGDFLLDTDAAWVAFGKAAAQGRSAVEGAFGGPGGFGPRPRPQVNERFLADQMVPQYPWQWSAGVLAGLVGLSTCILTLRVKSLDRLR